MTDRLRELARELEEFKTGTQPRNKSARERLEVETIHKTLNVVLSKIDALVRASAERTEGASYPHRCSGCGLRWHTTMPGSVAAELCGDCWRRVQPTLDAASAPAAVRAPLDEQETTS